RLGEDHPFPCPHAGLILQERGAFLKGQQGGEKAQSASGERLVEVVQKQPAEQARQNFDRQEETGSAGDPSLAAWRNPTTGDQTVQVRMMEQVLAPSMQHAQEADLGAQMGRISRDGAESLGR